MQGHDSTMGTEVSGPKRALKLLIGGRRSRAGILSWRSER